jgi:uncharacterized protein (TIGR03000 family)
VFFAHSIRFGTAAAAVALAAQVASAAPPVRVSIGGVRVAPVAAPYYRAAPYYSGYRGGVSIGIGIGGGYGSGLYGPLGYGLGYSPFGYSGLPYGGVGYGALGYGYGYPPTRVVVGVPIGSIATPRPYQSIPVQPMVAPGADPIPLPLPAPDNSGRAEPATITVVTSEGATVTFDDLASEQTGTRHSFTTKPIASGAEARVNVTVNGPNGPSSVSIRVRSGEKATVDMRN